MRWFIFTIKVGVNANGEQKSLSITAGWLASVLISGKYIPNLRPAKATLLKDRPQIDFYFNLSTTASFFCPQGSPCGEVSLS